MAEQCHLTLPLLVLAVVGKILLMDQLISLSFIKLVIYLKAMEHCNYHGHYSDQFQYHFSIVVFDYLEH
jgi:hypothetical protein